MLVQRHSPSDSWNLLNITIFLVTRFLSKPIQVPSTTRRVQGEPPGQYTKQQKMYIRTTHKTSARLYACSWPILSVGHGLLDMSGWYIYQGCKYSGYFTVGPPSKVMHVYISCKHDTMLVQPVTQISWSFYLVFFIHSKLEWLTQFSDSKLWKEVFARKRHL